MAWPGTADADGERAFPRAPLRGLPVTEQTLPALLARQAQTCGDAPLVRCGTLTRSFSEVRDAAASTGGTLAAAGIRTGDRVAMLCNNRLELLDLVLGCAWLGAIAVPINTALRGAQLEHILTNAGPRLLVSDSVLAARLAAIPRPPELQATWALDGIPADAPASYEVSDPPPAGPPVAARTAAPGDTAAILYTSGTTGVSKGVCCPHAQFYWWGILVGEQLGIEAGDVLYTNLPLFHTNALNAFVQALVAGATFALGPRFSASRFWSRLVEAEGTVTYLLGAMVNILMAQPPGELDRAHRVHTALAPATPAPLLAAFRERFGVQLVDGYGSTETNCAIGAWRGQQRGGYMGRARADCEAAVVDGHDTAVPDGTPGELILRPRAPFCFATGYFEMPEQTVQAWRNLWFHTGDRVVREPDGWFRFVDRLKDVIRRRGENISAVDVEHALLEHPDVAAVAAFPVPSELAEDEVMVAVVVRDGAPVIPSELVAHCEPRLAAFAIPRYVEFVEELPLTENGKVRKGVLRERGVTDATWDRAAP